MSQLNLTSGQRHRLQRQLLMTEDVHLFRRTLAILEYDHARPAADIARMLGVTGQTVYNWVRAYVGACDPTVLQDQRGGAYRRLLDEDAEHLLEALLAFSPQELDYPHTSWTVPLLLEALEIATGQRVSDDTLRRTLRRLNYVWKRPRYDFDPDPEREKKTSYSPGNSCLATSQRRAGPGRNRPAALPAAACRLVEAWRSGQGVVERAERPPSHLRSNEPADGNASVSATPEGPKR
jgi:transposase